jgi:hypothetical protein
MSGETELKASEKLAKHIEEITNYINLTNTKFIGFKEEFLLVADLSSDSIKKLTQQECFDATYIQEEINKNKIALNWCNDQMEKLIVSNQGEFGQYTKHESKKYILAKSNNYAASLENMREVAEARLQSLDGKVFELKRKADILLEKGKRS